MASACVNTGVAMSPEAFGAPAKIPAAYGWISPRVSFSRDFAADESSAAPPPPRSPEKPDPDGSLKDLPDFEFRLHDPVAMLPADELISNGRLVPLQVAAAAERREGEARAAEEAAPQPPRIAAVLRSEAYAQSPRAPKCSSRWRELLRLKKQQQSPKPEPQKPAPAPSRNPNPRSIRHLLHRSPRSTPALDASQSLPLLRDPDVASVSISISSRFSLSSSSSSSSSSSGPDHDEHPRLSLDSEKLSQSQIQAPPRLRLSRPRSAAAPRVGRSPMRRDAAAAAAEGDASPPPPPPRGPSVDSPRLNAAGKVVFQGLERSSSSPSTFNGGPRVKHRPGIERSYSANVRVAPVLNVPVCSLRGSAKGPSVFALGTLFSSSSLRRERDAPSSSSSAVAMARGRSRSKMDKDKASGH